MASAAPELPLLARDQDFEYLYRRYVKDVYHYALALLRNPADAEDVTQTTFLNAFRAYQRGEEVLKPQNWLIKIAHNVARTRYARASCRVKEVPLEDHVDVLAVPEEERPNIEGVLRALGRLPFNQRAALVMRELEGRSYAEIADTLGVSVAAVETLIFRARRSLRLRASALRVLTTVPLPSSLAQLLEGGSIVAGGSAIVGTGLLAKAAVALVAGAVATGVVTGDRTGRATAARESGALGVAPASVGVNSLTSLKPGTGGAQGARPAFAEGVTNGPATTAQGGPFAAQPLAVVLFEAATQMANSVAGSPGSSSAPTLPTEQVTTAATGAIGAAQQTAETASGALPVQTPSVPAVPVQVPSVPALPVQIPSLPAVPVQIPSVPAVPVQVPSLPRVPVQPPPPPPLPKLP
jgi:RNA polymerase sigma factor (sigma-70 family)